MGCHPSLTDPCGLLRGCSSPSTAPAWLCTTRPFKYCSTWFPMGGSSPSLPAPPQAAAVAQAAPTGSLHGLFLLQASSIAALWAPPWLHLEISVVLVGCTGMVFSSVDLSWTTKSCCVPGAPPAVAMVAGQLLSHFSFLSPSFCCTAVSPFLKSPLPERTKHNSWLGSGSGGSLLEQLCSDMEYCWALLTEVIPATKTLPRKPSIVRNRNASFPGMALP